MTDKDVVDRFTKCALRPVQTRSKEADPVPRLNRNRRKSPPQPRYEAGRWLSFSHLEGLYASLGWAVVTGLLRPWATFTTRPPTRSLFSGDCSSPRRIKAYTRGTDHR